MIHYIAVHYGHMFTRSTANRVYTHCIVRMYSVVQARIEAERIARAYCKSNLKYSQEVAAGKWPSRLIEPTQFHPSSGMLNEDGTPSEKYEAYVTEHKTRDAQRMAENATWLAKGEEGLVAERLASHDAWMAEAPKSANGVYYYVGGDEWCGRPDLAAVALARHAKRGVKAFAVPAQIVDKKPKKD